MQQAAMLQSVCETPRATYRNRCSYGLNVGLLNENFLDLQDQQEGDQHETVTHRGFRHICSRGGSSILRNFTSHALFALVLQGSGDSHNRTEPSTHLRPSTRIS